MGFRKNKSAFAYSLLILIISLVPFIGMAFHPTITEIGNRSLPDFPVFRVEGKGYNAEYLVDLTDWFEQCFAFRPEIISVGSAIQEKLFRQSSTGDVIVGRDGWLYYSATLDDFQHRNSISERMLFNIAHNMALMQEYTKKHGTEFIFTIAPNKNTLYPDNMPERYRYKVAGESDSQRLIPYLKDEGVNYTDLFELFQNRNDELYYARDSHWTEEGAVLVYRRLLEDAGLRLPDFIQDTGRTERVFGDLNRMLYPVGGTADIKKVMLPETSWEYIGEADDVEDMYIETESKGSGGSLLMYRDSFGNSLLPYMAETFGNAVFSKIVPYSMDDLENTGADLLIVEKVERHLPTLGTVAPIMEAPGRDVDNIEEMEQIDTAGGLPEIQLTTDGEFYRVSGILPMEGDAKDRIYLIVEDEEYFLGYEAFCIGKEESDFGYEAYIPVGDINGGIQDIRIYTDYSTHTTRR